MHVFIRTFWVILVLGVSIRLNQGCKDVTPGEIDEEWYMSVEKNGGWDQPLGSKYDPAAATGGVKGAGKGKDKPRLKGKNKKCMKAVVQLATMPEEQTLDSVCYYDEFNQQSCVVKTHDDPILETLFKFYGDFVFTKSDDENYAIVYGCVLGKIDHWVALIPNGTDVEPFREEILEHVRDDIGMGTEDKDLKSEDDPVYFKSFTGNECKEDEKKKIPSLGKGKKGSKLGKLDDVSRRRR